MILCHIVPENDWKNALEEGSYQPPSLQSEGFIHFSTPQQVIKTANRFYAHQSGLLLLLVDTTHLTAELLYEKGEGSNEVFPHLYGALNLGAVEDVLPFPVNPDGSFQIPAKWRCME